MSTTVAGRPPASCPHHHRKSGRGAPTDAPAVEQKGEVWHLRSYRAVRQVLRDADATRQAGFNAELAGRSSLRQPVLFQDGAEHREQRTAIARFFTPKTVGERYLTLMEELSDQLVERVARDGSADLDDVSLSLAVEVAARVVGLTDSRRPGMERRLEAVLSLERLERLGPLGRARSLLQAQARMWWFYLNDVRPAIAARHRSPREDVVSHLIAKGYRPIEILIECITYGAAGMATTREFISMAAWHLLEAPDLKARYLAADEPERHRILHEILRLEPVVAYLYRRTVADLEVEHEGTTTRIPKGALVELDLRAANADAAAVGAEPLQLCPQRALSPGVQSAVLSFGDGAHRCPGAFIAIQESDVFLRRLLQLPLRIEVPPRLAWNDLIESYELRGFRIAVAPAA
ncbi:MAG: cytochrome P450 [bacterium]|nr:cytochrome P450 [bacterium]